MFHYTRAMEIARERARERMLAAQPELGRDWTFHLCHNWGNDAARATLAQHDELFRRLTRRCDRELARRDHAKRHGPGFSPLWCRFCRSRAVERT